MGNQERESRCDEKGVVRGRRGGERICGKEGNVSGERGAGSTGEIKRM